MINNKVAIGTYKNGNYTTTIYSDGSRDRVSEAEAFIPSFPESIELKITEEYEGEHPWFYSKLSEEPRNAKLMKGILDPLNKYIKAIRPLTEVTILGGHVDHPEILDLLVFLRQRRAQTKLIVGQEYFVNNYHRIYGWKERRLIKNLGIILINSEDQEFLNKLRDFPGATIIVTSGIFNGEDLDNLENSDISLLIQGYVSSENNKEYTEENSTDFEYNKSWLVSCIDKEVLKAVRKVSFDNLALLQLGIDDGRFTDKDKDFTDLYFGEDGEFSLYIDMVNGEFSGSEYSKERYKIEENMTPDQMFREIRKKRRI